MNKAQKNYYRMFFTTQEFLNNNATIWSGVPRITTYKNEFDEIMIHLSEKSDETLSEMKITDKKERLKALLGQKLSVVSGILTAYAHENEDFDLVKKVKFVKTDVQKIKEVDLPAIAKSIIVIARNLKDNLVEFGLSDGILDETDLLIEDLNGMIGKPRNIQNKKFVAINQLSDLINEGINLLKNKMDKLMLMFSDSHPDFYNGYKRARTIEDR